MSTIFVVAEEANSRKIIKEYLTREKFKVEAFAVIEEVLERLQSGFPDIFIMEMSIPPRNSLDFYLNMKKRSGLPIVVISEQGQELKRITGLELTPENYLDKPFSPRELISLVRSLLRCSALSVVAEELVRIGNLEINPNDRHTAIDEREVMLTPMEYEFLLLLAQQPQRTFNRQELLDRIWGCDYVGSSRAVDDLVKRLRKKLSQSGSNNNIKTIWGYGYRFEE
ncbi:MAG: response regulator transcription factor [Syntrophomonadaceae bacterium]|nr:response regulator transcription factor [Syntrophomonadaceae bacterium]